MLHNYRMSLYLEFFGKLYSHLDEVVYVPGIMMLYKALPPVLQAHFIEMVDDEKLPDPTIFKAFKNN